MMRILGCLGLIVLLTAAGAAWWAYGQAATPYQGYDGQATVVIERGTSTRAMALQLTESGVIRSELAFLLCRAVRSGDNLLAGEYRFDQPLSAWDVFEKIVSGDVFYYQLTFPEGWNRFEIAEEVETIEFLDGQRFAEIAAKPDLIAEQFPNAENLEGFLFPDTYSFSRQTTEADLAEMMVGRFQDAFEKAKASATAEIGDFDAVVLASMIEKETGVGGERALVGSVFHNRMRRGMRMQCDPTVIYGMILAGTYNGRLLTRDLENPHRYNTYAHGGLPPGPIANPGLAALEGAFAPKESSYLYFVASADGTGHQFSRSLIEHNRAVVAYRSRRRR